MSAEVRARYVLRVGVWRRALLDVPSARRTVLEFVEAPGTRGGVVVLEVGRVPAWPDLAEYEGWPDEPPSYARVPSEWVDLVRHAGMVILDAHWSVMAGWERLLAAARAAADA